MPTRLSRKDPETMEELIIQFISRQKHNNQMNRQRIFALWNEVSGTEKYTIDKYIKDRVLYCTINSSMMRNQLNLRLKEILEKMNKNLKEDKFFVSDLINNNNRELNGKYSEYGSGEDYIKSIVLK